jgi:HSP20 family molecular chaperone IbpA
MLDATQPRRDDQKPDLPRSIPSGLWTGCLVSFGEASVSRHSGTWSNRRFGQIRAPTSPPRRSSSREDEKTCQLTAELPGLSEKDINLTVSDDLLIVTGEKREEKELDEKNYHYSERRFGSFRRAVQLPQHVNRDKIEGELQERRARCEAAEDARRDAASAQDRGQKRVVLLPLDEWLDVGRCHQSNAMTQRRVEHREDIHLLNMSSYLVNYPFADRLYPRALEVLKHLRGWGRAVILSDSEVVFQLRKVERSGIFAAVEGNVLIYIHKEEELEDVDRRYPADHYVLIDDKPRILNAVKTAWGDERVTTVLSRQGQFANAADASSFPPPDLTIEQIGDLLACNLPGLLGRLPSIRAATKV